MIHVSSTALATTSCYGLEFYKRLHFQIIDHQPLLQDTAALHYTNQRAIDLQHMPFEQWAIGISLQEWLSIEQQG
ncbi:hypothetical protein ACNQP7_04710 [Mycolicibacterium fortuitum]|uniref:hypothetical protein n=1 Tax=Mycolicibacterium fortuitum TaxID=1766 RepID=UPI003AAAD7E7